MKAFFIVLGSSALATASHHLVSTLRQLGHWTYLGSAGLSGAPDRAVLRFVNHHEFIHDVAEFNL